MLLVFFAAPLWLIVELAVGAQRWAYVLSLPDTAAVLWRTLYVAAEVTLVCLLLGYVYASAMLRARGALRTVMVGAVVVPLLTSLLVRNYAWLVVLSRRGPVATVLAALPGVERSPDLIFNNFGVVVGMVHVLFPFLVLPLYAVMSQVDPRIAMAARSLGASRTVTFLRVTLPLSAPGAAAGATLVFIQALGFYVTPALLGGQEETMIAQLIQRQLSGTSLDLGAAAALATMLLLSVMALIVMFRVFYPLESLLISPRGLTSSHRQRKGERPRCSPALDVRMRSFSLVAAILDRLPWRGLSLFLAAATIIYMVLPLVIVIPVSFSGDAFLTFPPSSYGVRWYASILSSPEWGRAAVNSLVTGGLGTVCALVVGVPLSFALVRSPAWRQLKSAAIIALVLPAVLPLIITAVGVFVWFLRLQLLGSRLAIAGVYGALTLPLVTLICVAALRDFDVRLEYAARSLGARHFTTLRRITLPLLWRAVASGALFAFLFCLDELLIMQAVSRFRSSTLAVLIWEGANEQISPELAAYSTISLALALAVATVAAGVNRSFRRQPRAADEE